MTDAATTPGTEPAPPAPADLAADTLGARFEQLADDDFAGYCPVYERIARRIAHDDDALWVLGAAGASGNVPVLALAAVHDLVLAEPDGDLAAIYAGRSTEDPWPPFRALLLDRADAVQERMRTHSIQTNEVGRSAALVPALHHVVGLARRAGDDRPLALVEIGPSAGLNLLLDRYHVAYTADGAVAAETGPADSPVQLRCELRGPGRPPLGTVPLPVATRTGVDLHPVDVTDADARRWLAACVWPGIPDRPERLRAALDVAQLDPPTLVAGDARTDLGPLVDALPAEVLPVVISTWALSYVGGPGREAVLAALDAIGAHRDLALVTAEVPAKAPWIPPVPAATVRDARADGDGTGTVLGLRTWRGGAATDEVLALCHPHVRWMAWVPDEGERP